MPSFFMPQVTQAPYVSSFGQIWSDVSLLRVRVGLEELEELETQPLSQWLPEHFPTGERGRVLWAIEARAVYIRSFCQSCSADESVRSKAQSRLRAQVGGVEKCQGAHRPEAVWLEMIYPEFSEVAEYRQKRINDTVGFWDQVRDQHVNDCPLAACPFAGLRRASRKRRRAEVAHVLIFCRIHFEPKQFAFPPLDPTPVQLRLIKSSRLDRSLLDKAPLCACLPACSEVVVIRKPYGLPAEPHVSNALHCVQSQYRTSQSHLRTKDVHPVHRLDTLVGGVMALYLKRTEDALCETAVSVFDKSYKVLTICPEDMSSTECVIESLLAHPCVTRDGDCIHIKSFMPPSEPLITRDS